jgi:DNA-binding LacI/PurR family transcriptional regulator
MEGAARDRRLIPTSITLSEVTRAALDASVEDLLRQLAEGIIIAGQDHALDLVRSRTVNVSMVLVEGDLSRAELTVGVDQVSGARMATAHLLQLGHREIVHLGGPQDWREARARLDGWRAEMTSAGLRPPEPIVGTWAAEFGHSAGAEITRSREITAVFAANDQIALGLLSALHGAGRAVPGDISVVGFDNQPEAAYLVPPLTTVGQDFPAVGRRAVDNLICAMSGVDGAAPKPYPARISRQVQQRATASLTPRDQSVAPTVSTR